LVLLDGLIIYQSKSWFTGQYRWHPEAGW